MFVCLCVLKARLFVHVWVRAIADSVTLCFRVAVIVCL